MRSHYGNYISTYRTWKYSALVQERHDLEQMIKIEEPGILKTRLQNELKKIEKVIKNYKH